MPYAEVVTSPVERRGRPRDDAASLTSAGPRMQPGRGTGAATARAEAVG